MENKPSQQKSTCDIIFDELASQQQPEGELSQKSTTFVTEEELEREVGEILNDEFGFSAWSAQNAIKKLVAAAKKYHQSTKQVKGMVK